MEKDIVHWAGQNEKIGIECATCFILLIALLNNLGCSCEKMAYYLLILNTIFKPIGKSWVKKGNPVQIQTLKGGIRC